MPPRRTELVSQRVQNPAPWHIWSSDSTVVRRYRHEFIAYLRLHACAGSDYEAAELIFGELVANAVMHAPGSLDVTVDWESNQAVLHVSDQGAPINVRSIASPDPDAEHGRGLWIISTLAHKLTAVTHAGGGKTVSATLPIQRAPA